MRQPARQAGGGDRLVFHLWGGDTLLFSVYQLDQAIIGSAVAAVVPEHVGACPVGDPLDIVVQLMASPPVSSSHGIPPTRRPDVAPHTPRSLLNLLIRTPIEVPIARGPNAVNGPCG